MEEKKKPKEDSQCIGSWKMPKHCEIENGTCEYYAEWKYSSRNDEIHFNIRTINSGAWTGIAFSEDTRMANSDAILGGWVDNLGKPFIMDTWIHNYSATGVKLDQNQNIYNINGSVIDGVMSLSFTRKRISTDPEDLSFTDDDCLYVFFPTNGGRFDFVSKKIWKHSATPYISSEKICIKSCDNELDDGGTSNEIADNPNNLKYNVEIKIVELGENFKIPKPNSVDYEDLTNQINDNFKPLFKKIPGYRKFKITDIREDNKNIIASMDFQIDKSVAGQGRSFEDDTAHDEEVEKIIKDSIVSGTIGRFTVDKNHLNFEPQHLTSNIIPDSSSESATNFFNLSETKLYIVLGCIAALVLVAIVQASCTIYKTASKSSSSHKDHLIPNSAWKDYSAANTNYAFETYEDEKKQINGKGRTETLPPKQSRVPKPQGRPPSVPNPHAASTWAIPGPCRDPGDPTRREIWIAARSPYPEPLTKGTGHRKICNRTFISCLRSGNIPGK
ncbi:hypothetical protein QE152_g33703 [Popillia japonica]|uniref:DOMON domain-containing protein n=1 Tax=Popillia japonica TaxID=7064 RepID=A0AAW1IVA5_POPJA